MPRWWSQRRNLRVVAAFGATSTLLREATHGFREPGFFGVVDAILIAASVVLVACSFRRDLRNPAWPEATRDTIAR